MGWNDNGNDSMGVERVWEQESHSRTAQCCAGLSLLAIIVLCPWEMHLLLDGSRFAFFSKFTEI